VPAAEGLELAGVAIDGDADVDIAFVAFLGRLRKRMLQGSENDLLVHILFARQRIDQQ